MNFRRSDGFALPTVLIASIVMLTVLLVAVTSTAAIRVALVSQYYNQLAQTAGDAGAAYAKACLITNNGKPLWNNTNKLKPDTDCAGVQLASCPTNPATAACHAVLLDSNSNVFTTFTVGLPQLDSNGLAVDVASVGATKLIRSSDLASGVVTAWRQYNQTSNLIIANSPTVTMYSWGGGGAGGTLGGWTYGSNGGAGGAAQGMMDMNTGIYPVVVGGAGTINSYSATFSCAIGGGGCGSNSNSDNRYGGGGGGYSGIFMSSISQSNALLIAGGGGGGGSVWSTNGTTSSTSGGAGGGTTGQMGYGDVDTASYKGQPGTQSAAGATASGTYLNISGTAGANIQGALQGGTTISNSWGGGGGGGYWGGSAGGYYSNGPTFPVNQMTGGGGGSGYFNSTYVSSGLLSSGSGTTPGNSSSSLRGTAGNAGGYQTNGSNGVVIISYPTGSIMATGGSVTTSGGYTFHTFTSSGNFIVAA